MVKKTRRAKPPNSASRTAGPAINGVRDAERHRSQGEGTAPKLAGGPAEKGPGRKGRSSGGGDSAGESRASAGPDRKDKR